MRWILSIAAAAACLVLSEAPAAAHWWPTAWTYPEPFWGHPRYDDRLGAPRPPVFVYTTPRGAYTGGYMDEDCRVLTEPTPYGWRRIRVCQ